MANRITEACVNCGACESVCPAGGISKGEDIFTIDQSLCTECVGFYHTQQCARVCPVDASIVDPDNTETEAVLFERAQKMAAKLGRTLELGPETSHFQADQRTSTLTRMARRLGSLFQGSSRPPTDEGSE